MIGWLRKLFPSAQPGGQAHDHAGDRAPVTARRASTGDPFVINLYDDRAVVHRPDGQREEIAWDALERVVVRVSDRAPWAGTAWLILAGDTGSKQGCVVPLDAANHDALVAHLRTLPGFNQQKLDNALRDAAAGRSRTDANLWKRGDASRNVGETPATPDSHGAEHGTDHSERGGHA
ncbi:MULTISPECIES: hypothetical protein [unclassified Cupriavidus]|uniref:hypothetical protein n=1 Tax=Cupriavidus sp. H19C3 TaxID=3241603 RepID=UPI003BF849ED